MAAFRSSSALGSTWESSRKLIFGQIDLKEKSIGQNDHGFLVPARQQRDSLDHLFQFSATRAVYSEVDRFESLSLYVFVH
jgi:hypothetical protein